MSHTAAELEQAVREIAEEMRERPDRGAVADYIPELATVDPRRFGIAVIDTQGRVATGGDADAPFSIQSISKVFTLTLALGMVGDRLWRRVGREPSGTPSTRSCSWSASAASRATPSSTRARSRSPT